MEAQRLELLYHFSKLWDLWGNFSLLLTTFVERADDEYFSGFCSVHWLVSQWSSQEEIESASQEYDNEQREEEQEVEEGAVERAPLEQLSLEVSSTSEESNMQDHETFCWFHMSLMFRASPRAVGSNWMPN